MNTSQLRQAILDYSEEIGIDKLGFASADVFESLKQRLKRQQELAYQSGFEKGSIAERTEPDRLLPEAKSIISIALAYPSRTKDRPANKKEEQRGVFCRASWGRDYHEVLKNKLSHLDAFIRERIPDAATNVMVDTGELSDRAVAERAGIGFSGKNTSIITPEFGSYVYLGEIITNIPFVPDTPLEDGCGSCTKCMDACPTGALVQGGQLDAQKCLAFQTQTKDFMPEEYRSKIGHFIYGFDTCQAVCPYNKHMDVHKHPEFEPDLDVAKPKLKPMLRISNREFKETFGHVAGSWRGKKPLQRNALIALGNYKDKASVEEIISVMNNDPRPVIRGTAAWSLGKIGTEEAYTAIKDAMKQEQDDQVVLEMEKGLAFQELTAD